MTIENGRGSKTLYLVKIRILGLGFVNFLAFLCALGTD